MNWLRLLPVLCLLLPLRAAAVAVVPDLPLPLDLRELPILETRAAVRSPGLARLGEGRLVAAWLLRPAGGKALVQHALYDAARGAWSAPSEQALPGGADPGESAECLVISADGGHAEFRWQAPLGTGGPVLVSRLQVDGNRLGAALSGGFSQASTQAFPDGTRLSVSREVLPDGSIAAVQRRAGPAGDPEQPAPVAGDAWRGWTPACGGLRLAALAPRAVLAWHTGLDGDPAILLAQTPDAGLRWQQPLRCDLGHPVGPPDLVLGRDAAAMLCWRESGGDDPSQPAGLYFRRYATNGATTLPTLLEITRAGDPAGAPRLALLKDAPGVAPVLLVLVPGPRGLRSLQLTLPTRRELLEADRSCQCAEEPGAWVQLRAEVLSLDAKAFRCVISHGPVPGLVAAEQRREVALASDLVPPVPGCTYLMRIEQLGHSWRIVGLRQLGEPVIPQARP